MRPVDPAPAALLNAREDDEPEDDERQAEAIAAELETGLGIGGRTGTTGAIPTPLVRLPGVGISAAFLSYSALPPGAARA